MRRHKRTKRGLSTIVTGAILLTAVAMMGIMVVAWANTNLTKHQMELESTLTSTYNKLNEKILIEHVWFGTTPSNNINITMNNIGTVGLNVTAIQITDIDTGQSYSYTHTDAGIVSGGTHSFNETLSWITDTPYEVLITTNRDSQFRTEVLAP